MARGREITPERREEGKSPEVLVGVMGEYVCIGLPPCDFMPDPEGTVFKMRYTRGAGDGLKRKVADNLKEIGKLITSLSAEDTLGERRSGEVVREVTRLLLRPEDEKKFTAENKLYLGKRINVTPFLPGTTQISSERLYLGGLVFEDQFSKDRVRYTLVVDSNGQAFHTADGFLYRIVDEIDGMESHYVHCSYCGSHFMSGETKNCVNCGGPN